MTITATTKRVREIITDVQEGKLIPKPAFQRRKVWSNKDKAYFIDTVLRGYPFPEIYWADGKVDVETGRGTTLIVDGQQRVTTLYEYFVGHPSLKLPPEIAPYADLSDEKKKAFLDYVVVVRHLGDLTNDKLIEVFSRINITSYNLNPMEINNALYDGPLKKLAEELTQLDFFSNNQVFKPLQIKRMGDTRFTLSVLITMMDGYFNRDEKLEEYLERFNDSFPREDEIRARFFAAIEFIEACGFSQNSRVWQQTTLYCLISEVDKIMMSHETPLDTGVTFQRIQDFFSLWNNFNSFVESDFATTYDRASVQAANDRQNRVRRGRILRAVILGEEKLEAPKHDNHGGLPLFSNE